MAKTSKTPKDIKQSVMSKIKHGDVQMHSKIYFWALSGLLVLSSTVFLVMSAILLSLSVHEIRVGHELGLNEFGPKGRVEFLASLPWAMITFGLLAVAAAILLARKFELSYKHRFYTVVAVVVATVISLGVLASVARIDERAGQLPPLKPLRTFSRFTEDRQLVGKVVEIKDSYAVVVNIEGKETKLEWDQNTRFMHGDTLSPGDEIVAVGNYEGKDTFEAFGIRINPEFGSRVRGAMRKHEIIPSTSPY